MKIAYIILAHNKFSQFQRLMGRLDQGDASFILHISSNCEPGFFEQVKNAYGNLPNVHFARRRPVKWGDISLARASLNCIHTLVESGIDYEYAILLSGQDYPLQSHQTICKTLADGGGRQFMEYLRDDALSEDDYYRLYSYHLWIKQKHLWYPYPRKATSLVRLLDSFLSLLLPRVRTLPNHFRGYKGSFWWQLTRDCVEYLDEFNQTHTGKRFLRYLSLTYQAAEYYYQTVLMNSPFREHVINTDNHFALWSEDSGHPKTLGLEDIEDIRSSGALFGRKFDIDHIAAIFDLLDASIDSEEKPATPTE